MILVEGKHSLEPLVVLLAEFPLLLAVTLGIKIFPDLWQGETFVGVERLLKASVTGVPQPPTTFGLGDLLSPPPPDLLRVGSLGPLARRLGGVLCPISPHDSSKLPFSSNFGATISQLLQQPFLSAPSVVPLLVSSFLSVSGGEDLEPLLLHTLGSVVEEAP